MRPFSKKCYYIIERLFYKKGGKTMNIFLKQSRRKPIFTIFMIILLCLALSLSLIGFSSWASAKAQFDSISSEYTTIAIRKIPNTDGLSVEKGLEQSVLYYECFMAAENAPMIKSMETRIYLGAHIAGSKALSSSAMDPSELNDLIDDERYSFGAFVLECTEIENHEADILHYTAYCNVLEVLSLSSAYDWYPEINEMNILGNIYNADGSVPFEAGKKYIVYGTYNEYQTTALIESFVNNEHWFAGNGYMQARDEFSYRYLHAPHLLQMSNWQTTGWGVESFLRGTNENGIEYYYPLEDSLPWVAEITGTTEEFLESEEGKVWREEIIPLCEMNQQSAVVYLTDNLDSIYPFNIGSSYLVEGRDFSEKDYSAGNNVCLISADYAKLNNLSVGDSVTMDLYNTGVTWMGNGARTNSIIGNTDLGGYMIRQHLNPKDRIDVCKDYEIIGIYSTPRFSFGVTSFDADHIIIPKKSVPNAEQYEPYDYWSHSTFVLKHGTIDEFEQYMTEQGYPEMFIYNDQGYSAMEETLLALEANAKRMMNLGMSVFALITALFLFLNFRRMMPVIRGVRLLGKTAGRTRNEVFAVLFMEETLSVIIGTVLAAVLYNSITSAMLSEAIALDFKNLLSAAAALLGILGILSFMLSGILSNVKLMKRK